MMESYKSNLSADSIFDLVHFDNYRSFIRLAANYNVLADFFHTMPPERMRDLLRRFIGGIERDETTGLETAMDIADSFTALVTDPMLGEAIEDELKYNLVRCRSNQNYLGMRLYGILTDIYSQVKQDDGMNKLWATLGDYENLKRDALVNQKGEVIETILFYGDEDGIASFSNFLRLYGDKRKWEVTRNSNWVTIRSTGNTPLVIYANLPLNIKDELDLRAQDSLFAYFDQQGIQPAILVHRGHSYHLEKTLRRLTSSVRLAILGSCGGYNKSISIATINPDVQVIGSKKTGSMSINDPILVAINETLVQGNDLSWPAVWKHLEEIFSKEESTLSLFNEYFPPSHNLGLFVLKLFKYYNRLA
jgi:hypothetical protein